jgi:DNA repair exonuclease SbcCD nuclease subunit
MQKPIKLPVKPILEAASEKRLSRRVRPTPDPSTTRSQQPCGADDQVIEQARPASGRTRLVSDLPDAAVLIGLTMHFARMGNFRPGSVPDVILTQLGWHGLAGDHAALLALSHIHRRALLHITDPEGRVRLQPNTNSAIGGAA